jgi:hypothetical protein
LKADIARHGEWLKDYQRYADGMESHYCSDTVCELEALNTTPTPPEMEEMFPPDPLLLQKLDEIEMDDEPDIDGYPRVIIAASSTWNNHAAIEREIFNWWQANGMIPVYVQIGDCPVGGEPMVLKTLTEFGLPYQVWNADTISPAQRDRAMVAAGADIAFIFIDEESTGATRVMDLCIGAGIPTIVSTRKVYRAHRRYDDQ